MRCHTNVYLVYMLLYQVYDWSFSMPCHMGGLFPMPCHMADSRQDRLYVNFYILVTDTFISIHFLFILSSRVCNSVWEQIGQVIQVCSIPGACVKYWDIQSITYDILMLLCHMTSCTLFISVFDICPWNPAYLKSLTYEVSSWVAQSGGENEEEVDWNEDLCDGDIEIYL